MPTPQEAAFLKASKLFSQAGSVVKPSPFDDLPDPRYPKDVVKDPSREWVIGDGETSPEFYDPANPPTKKYGHPLQKAADDLGGVADYMLNPFGGGGYSGRNLSSDARQGVVDLYNLASAPGRQAEATLKGKPGPFGSVAYNEDGSVKGLITDDAATARWSTAVAAELTAAGVADHVIGSVIKRIDNTITTAQGGLGAVSAASRGIVDPVTSSFGAKPPRERTDWFKSGLVDQKTAERYTLADQYKIEIDASMAKGEINFSKMIDDTVKALTPLRENGRIGHADIGLVNLWNNARALGWPVEQIAKARGVTVDTLRRNVTKLQRYLKAAEVPVEVTPWPGAHKRNNPKTAIYMKTDKELDNALNDAINDGNVAQTKAIIAELKTRKNRGTTLSASGGDDNTTGFGNVAMLANNDNLPLRSRPDRHAIDDMKNIGTDEFNEFASNLDDETLDRIVGTEDIVSRAAIRDYKKQKKFEAEQAAWEEELSKKGADLDSYDALGDQTLDLIGKSEPLLMRQLEGVFSVDEIGAMMTNVESILKGHPKGPLKGMQAYIDTLDSNIKFAESELAKETPGSNNAKALTEDMAIDRAQLAFFKWAQKNYKPKMNPMTFDYNVTESPIAEKYGMTSGGTFEVNPSNLKMAKQAGQGHLRYLEDTAGNVYTWNSMDVADHAIMKEILAQRNPGVEWAKQGTYKLNKDTGKMERSARDTSGIFIDDDSTTLSAFGAKEGSSMRGNVLAWLAEKPREYFEKVNSNTALRELQDKFGLKQNTATSYLSTARRQHGSFDNMQGSAGGLNLRQFREDLRSVKGILDYSPGELAKKYGVDKKQAAHERTKALIEVGRRKKDDSTTLSAFGTQDGDDPWMKFVYASGPDEVFDLIPDKAVVKQLEQFNDPGLGGLLGMLQRDIQNGVELPITRRYSKILDNYNDYMKNLKEYDTPEVRKDVSNKYLARLKFLRELQRLFEKESPLSKGDPK